MSKETKQQELYDLSCDLRVKIDEAEELQWEIIEIENKILEKLDHLDVENTCFDLNNAQEIQGEAEYYEERKDEYKSKK